MNERQIDARIDLVRRAVASACRTQLENLHPQTGPADVKGWDSFGRLQVLLEIERRLGRELPLNRAMAANSIAEIAAILGEAVA